MALGVGGSLEGGMWSVVEGGLVFHRWPYRPPEHWDNHKFKYPSTTMDASEFHFCFCFSFFSLFLLVL